jgi:hypothetical protein
MCLYHPSTPETELQAQITQLNHNLTSFESVNEFIKLVPRGWNATTMAQDLEERFWVETKILTKDNVQYLFLRFKCNCCPTAEWWWVTYQGLKPANLAPVHP